MHSAASEAGTSTFAAAVAASLDRSIASWWYTASMFDYSSTEAIVVRESLALVRGESGGGRGVSCHGHTNDGDFQKKKTHTVMFRMIVTPPLLRTLKRAVEPKHLFLRQGGLGDYEIAQGQRRELNVATVLAFPSWKTTQKKSTATSHRRDPG